MAAGRLRIVKCNGRRYPFEVAWYEGGKRRRSFCQDKKEAERLFESKKEELRHAAPAEAAISIEERRAVMRARQLGVPLVAAVESYAEKAAVEQRSLPVAELVRRYLAAAAKRNLSERYEIDLQRTVPKIGAFFDGRSVSSITTEDAAAWSYAGGEAPGTIRWRKAILSGVLEYGRRIGALERNAAEHVEVPKAASTVTGILSPEEARDYLLAVATTAPALLAMEAIRLFAGLRRAEAERLDWSRVKLARGFIEVTEGSAKTRSRRLVDIEPVLEDLLGQLGIPRSGPVMPPNSKLLRDRAMKAAGWIGDKHGRGAAEDARPWPSNALRHSFVSYHLALYGDVSRTELQAGHDRKILFKHYRELVTAAEAEEFWALTIDLGG